MSISPTDACFEGFRITRSRPGAVLVWSAVWLVGLLLVAFVMAPFVAPHLTEMLSSEGRALSEEANAAIARASWAVIPVFAVIQALLAPAVYRSVLRPSDRGFGGLRFGGAEVRMFALAMLFGSVSAAIQLVGEALQAIASSQGGFLAGIVVGLAGLALTLWVSVRLSLVAPATLAAGRFVFRVPIALAGRYFWPLLGMSVLCAVLAVVVVLLLVVSSLPLYLTAQGQSAPSALGMVASVVMLAIVPLGAALITTIVWAPFAAIWRDLQGASIDR